MLGSGGVGRLLGPFVGSAGFRAEVYGLRKAAEIRYGRVHFGDGS